jgi:hypothetical protein
MKRLKGAVWLSPPLSISNAGLYYRIADPFRFATHRSFCHLRFTG